MAIIFAFLVQNEPDWKETWKGRSYRSRAEFWAGAITVYFSFYFIVMFDFFFSSAAQTWLMWLIWVLVFILVIYAQGRGGDLFDLLNWQVNYVKEFAKDKAEKVGSLMYPQRE